MGAIRAEFLKLKRSMSWAVVILLPMCLVIAGAVNTIASGKPPEDGWHTMWLRSVVFYGLFPLAIGIAILASLVWRSEHRGGNWNALMSGPTPSFRLISAKAITVAVLAVLMQVVLLVTVVGVGKLVFSLPGSLPGEYLGISVLIILASVPVAIVQSGLSMLMRSFAGPIAVAFLGAGISIGLLLAKLDVAMVLPYALVARATQLGTGTFADTGIITIGGIVSIIVATLVLTAVLLIGSTTILDRRDTRV